LAPGKPEEFSRRSRTQKSPRFLCRKDRVAIGVATLLLLAQTKEALRVGALRWRFSSVCKKESLAFYAAFTSFMMRRVPVR